MWHFINRHILQYVARLDYHQLVLVTLAIVAVGVFCMRGYGSRSNY